MVHTLIACKCQHSICTPAAWGKEGMLAEEDQQEVKPQLPTQEAAFEVRNWVRSHISSRCSHLSLV